MTNKTLLMLAAILLLKMPLMATNKEGKSKKPQSATVITSTGITIAMPYPSKAYERGIEGFVLVELNRNTAGNLIVTQINGSSPELIAGVAEYFNNNTHPTYSQEEPVIYQFIFTIY
ncbi:MAG: hypothetical protein CVU11_04270 [Bacteroidetes bacterium HGW-Bacteroidetes-6]|nr:MAG: hypothetical protein CVU11_04270 [Bacteroidetes bacterium HGW-Bacteroidetes-6]